MWYRLVRMGRFALLLAIMGTSLSISSPRPEDDQDRARAFTREIEFDYVGWVLDAAQLKAEAAAAGLPNELDRASGRVMVSDYLQLNQSIIRSEEALNRIYADPSVADKRAASSVIRASLDHLKAQERILAPLAESVLQDQVAQVLASQGLSLLGQPLPPVLFRDTAVPDALVVSPRAAIRQIANISIQTDMPLQDQVALEQQVEAAMDASALVVPIGGVGVYPTMIMRTTDRQWLISTIAHEWTHNYLQFRPLGTLYDSTPELRTMNETTAEIVGTETGQHVVDRFYPHAAAARPLQRELIGLALRYPDPFDNDPPPFDFRSQMHTTRVTVDAMLASGKIPEAEAYMERRRRDFVENGYYIRRLNQAYFAFYGAYAETPGGAAGSDPVGPAVRALRSQSRSLAEFVNRISWMTSFDELRRAVGQ
ncbi:MAG TPA: hypothetical protein VFH29_08630 [Anaerolineales bacterium]|nr:hypothetical protein [Anaerolineales bacterium]